MITTITLHELHPWTDTNEYEGEAIITLHGQRLWAYLLLPAANWNTYSSGYTLEAAYWLERNGEVERLPHLSEPRLDMIRESLHRLVGRVVNVDDEDRLIVESIIPITVDLDDSIFLDPPLPKFAIGDTIQITGLLKLDLDPDPDDWG